MEHFGRRLIGIFLSGVLLLMGIGLSGDPLSGYASGTHSLFAPLITRQVDAKPNDYLAVALVGLLDNTEIYTFRADGTDANRLTHNEWQERGPKFSPNGTQIAFWQHISTAGEIPALAQVKIMNVDGTNVRSVGSVADATIYGGLYWTSDGKYLVADVIDSDGFTELTLIEVASGEEIFIWRYYYWGLSPDERYLYRDYMDGLWIHDLTNPTAPPVLLDIAYTSAKLWHPYESELFYGESDENGKRIMAIQPDGSNLRLVATGNYSLLGWLNNGRNALLVAPGDRYYTVPSEGGDVVPYGGSSDLEVDFMAIAPNQDAILYATKPAIPSISVVYHPTTGSPIKLLECEMVNNLACLAGGADWAWDSSALLFRLRRFNGERWTDATGYTNFRRNPSTTVTPPNDIVNPQFLPGSTRYATGYEYQGEASLNLLDLLAGSQTRLVPELGMYVAVHEWRYVGR